MDSLIKLSLFKFALILVALWVLVTIMEQTWLFWRDKNNLRPERVRLLKLIKSYNEGEITRQQLLDQDVFGYVLCDGLVHDIQTGKLMPARASLSPALMQDLLSN